jgi:hypothetical protein
VRRRLQLLGYLRLRLHGVGHSDGPWCSQPPLSLAAYKSCLYALLALHFLPTPIDTQDIKSFNQNWIKNSLHIQENSLHIHICTYMATKKSSAISDATLFAANNNV